MTELKQKRLAFLEDTVAHYKLGNRSSRKTEYEETCCYCPQNKNSNGCAIGRHLTKKLAKQLDNYKDVDGEKRTGVANIKIFNQLTKDLKYLGKPFLHKIQILHDIPGNWTEEGISKTGQVFVNSIKKKYC